MTLLIRQAQTGALREIEDAALPFFANQGYVVVAASASFGAPTPAALQVQSVVHGTNANAPRPATAAPVIWFGTVDPVNADDTKDVTVFVAADTA